MLFKETLNLAWHDLRAKKGRTMLTMFGIQWGLTSVVMLVGWGVGFQKYFMYEFGKLGEKLIMVYPGRVETGLGGYRAGRRIRLTEKDILALKTTNYPYFEYITPEISPGFLTVKYKSESRSVHTQGVFPQTLEMRNFSVGQGRFINEEDLRQGRRVCFMGANIKNRLFGENKPAVGEYVKVNGIRFAVIGVSRSKGEQLSVWDTLDDDKLLIPFSTAQMLFVGTPYVDRVMVQVTSRVYADQCEETIRKTLAPLHGFLPDDTEALRVFNISEGMTEMERFGKGLQIFLGLVGAITLFIGGVGVMNIMLVAVRERTREIGIRKAVGAKRRHIFLQFLVEALVITFPAGGTGILLGMGLSWLLSQFPLPRFFMAPEVSPMVLLVAFSVMTGVGLFSGTLPAIRAARLHPIDALRYE
ncbi:hypothetical protein CEE39_00735 [bacterium (candidate division B38) B3_B38]|nr:MAG: hypothetical protein CEE39_00735 [bacterium (candidate division B38) B3_B38]